MHIESIRALHGPNVYHSKPVLLMEIELGPLTRRESREFEGFNERLVELLPGLRKHTCSRGHEGGFIERLREGTYFGHVVEHVALELETSIGARVTYGKTRYAGAPGRYHVIVRYQSEHAMRHLLTTAVELVEAVLAGRRFDVEPELVRARRIAAENDLGPSTRAIVDAAERRGLPWRRLNDANLVQFGYGRHLRQIQAALTDATSHIAVETASDKAHTKRLLKEAGIRTPRGGVASDLTNAVELLRELGGPVAVKPRYGNQGKGITLGVNQPAELVTAYQRARAFSPEVVIEEQLSGDDFRVLVVDGRMVAASRRTPCHVVGDGNLSIEDLIAVANQDPRRGEGHAQPLTIIEIDEQVCERLHAGGMHLGFIPAKGQRVYLRDFANLSTGATAVDVTDLVHPTIRLACERAAGVIGLDICGVDVVTSDISARFDGGVLELNAAPGLRMHVAPTEGSSRDVGGPIVDMLFPARTPSRIPICAVTGTNGKTTVTRMIGHILAIAGTKVGMTTTDGIYVGGERIAVGDFTGPASAQDVLGDRSVEVAVLETARGGLLRRGLGYDWSDVGVITNITADHIGQDGIEDLEDLVWIKSLVAERIKDGGTLVLNADDPESVNLAALDRVDVSRLRLVYFTLDARNPIVTQHLATGGTAFTVLDGAMVAMRGSTRERLMPLEEVAASNGGRVGFQLANCLAAAAAASAMGVPNDAIAAALRSFDTAEHNPGRVNLFSLGLGCVLVDYGHNPAAITASAELASLWSGPVLGIVGVPGDRSDELVAEAARSAARVFDRIYLREDRDLRGREPGEVAGLMMSAIAESTDVSCELAPDPLGTLSALSDEIAAGALAVIFYEDFEEVVQSLTQLGATKMPNYAFHAATAPVEPPEPANQTSAGD